MCVDEVRCLEPFTRLIVSKGMWVEEVGRRDKIDFLARGMWTSRLKSTFLQLVNEVRCLELFYPTDCSKKECVLKSDVLNLLLD